MALLRLTGERGIRPDARRSASSLLHPALCKLVVCKRSEDWSPEQIAGRRLEGLGGGGDPRVRTSPSARKWIARMRAVSETRNLLLCPTDQPTGHS